MKKPALFFVVSELILTFAVEFLANTLSAYE
jgi:hypothetical protein